MKKRVILVGKSAAGKDHARKICQQWLGMKYQVSYTTRPPRDGEEHGVDYYFVEKTTFEEMISQNLWYEYVMFNGWYYGTSKTQMEEANSVFIMTPAGLSHLSIPDRKESIVIYFDIDEETRRARMERRGGNADSVDRRIEADRLDFETYTDYDAVINVPSYSIVDIYNIVSQHMPLPHKDKFFSAKVS